MQYIFIADLHANLEAFNQLRSALAEADQIIFLGDLVGYGPNPNECIERLKTLKIQGIVGNHDQAVLGEMELNWFTEAAQAAILWTQAVVNPDNLTYLKMLPLMLETLDFSAVHGSLRDPLREYITQLSEAAATFNLMTKPLLFIGHSHVPLVIYQTVDGSLDGHLLADGEVVDTSLHPKVIINPGGVGQPRDGDPRASYGIYDTDLHQFTLHRIDYDFKITQEKMRRAGLPLILSERLAYGR